MFLFPKQVRGLEILYFFKVPCTIAWLPRRRVLKMALYRIYKISPDNHLTALPDVVVFSDDEDVIEFAKKQVNGQGVEAWDGTRVVVRLLSTDTF
jgi:hypothetical protein